MIQNYCAVYIHTHDCTEYNFTIYKDSIYVKKLFPINNLCKTWASHINKRCIDKSKFLSLFTAGVGKEAVSNKGQRYPADGQCPRAGYAASTIQCFVRSLRSGEYTLSTSVIRGIPTR